MDSHSGLEAGRFAYQTRALPLFDRALDMKRGHALAALALTFTAAFVIDAVTPVEMSFAFLYLVPIAIAGWAIGGRAALVTAAATPFATYAVERVTEYPFDEPIYYLSNFVLRLAYSAAFAWTVGALRATYLRTKIDTMRDAATGLYNRRGFYDTVAVELSRAQRFSRWISLAYIKVDARLDVATRARVASALATSRKYDHAASLGDGEFVLLLPETGAEAARRAIARVRTEIEKHAPARIGIATFEWPPTCVDELLREADRAMKELRGRAAGETLQIVNAGALTPVARSSRAPLAPETRR